MKTRVEVLYSGGSRTADSYERADLADAGRFLVALANAEPDDLVTLGGPPGEQLTVQAAEVDRVDLTWEA